MAASIYVTVVFFTPIALISILLCLILGFNLAVIGFNIMHEGGHQSFSKHSWLNNTSAYFLNVLGGNTYYWKIKHNVNHHTYTNIEGMDSDIDVKPFMRLHEGQPIHSYHRFQHIYWFVLYGISYLAWVFYEDFQKYCSGKVSKINERKLLALKEHFIFWITKILFIVVYMVIPIIMVGWWQWLIGFFIITFHVRTFHQHCISTRTCYRRNCSFTQQVLWTKHEKQEWAVHQISSTANFGTSSKFLHWLLGGLNFQIEHHLFPRVSHIHYPAISLLVKEACKESNIVYHEYTSMFKAVIAHILHLRELGSR